MELRRNLRLSNKHSRSSFAVVPFDLQIEILNRLPVKSLARFQLVSKSWTKLIQSKDFIRSFAFGSLTQPRRILIAFASLDRETESANISFFFSSPWSSSSTSLSTSFLSKVTFPWSKHLAMWMWPSCYINGLINIGSIICNPCTGKFILLPRIKKGGRYFGYDPVNDQYKVLSITRNEKRDGDVWSKFQIFTLGAKPKSWRRIECGIPHLSTPSSGVCINGVVYYITKTGAETSELSLVSFDLNSQKFDIFARVYNDGIHEYHRYGLVTLINYYGKVAVPITQSSSVENPEMITTDLFVFEAGKHDFLERSFHNLPKETLRMKDVNRAREIIFAPYSSLEVSVICYNIKGDTVKRIKIETDRTRVLYEETNYLMDYVESLVLL